MIKLRFQNMEILLNYLGDTINPIIKGRPDDQSEKELKTEAQVRQELRLQAALTPAFND